MQVDLKELNTFNNDSVGYMIAKNFLQKIKLPRFSRVTNNAFCCVMKTRIYN